MPTRKKIGLIGAGNIGGELARLCANEELGDVFLFDIAPKENFAKGKALDLEQNGAVIGYDSHIRGTSNWADLEGADVLVITAGIPRKPGQSRDDLVATNLPIIRDVAAQAKRVCPNAFVIVISNPLDAMVYEYRRVVGAPKNMVAGMAGVLDSARFQLFVAREAGVSVKDVRPMVLGGHGDDMVPVLSTTTINGIPVSALIAKDKLDKKRLLAAAAYLEGEYGYSDLFIGVPCVIGGKGVERIVEIPLSDDEKAMLAKSAKSVQAVVDICKKG